MHFRLISMLILVSCSPVKVICSILNISPNYVGFFSVIAFVVIVWANVKELAYFSVKVCSCLYVTCCIW
jgi:hypothetical protein